MRTSIVVLGLFALPSLAAAQQETPTTDAAPRVQLEQTVHTAPPSVELRSAEPDVEQVADRAVAGEDVALDQDPTTRQFWYIVLAVVVGGVILAVLL